ncbi:Uncharacterised protein [Enterobacter hormaechei]|nr:Uncharacterised protein [Enterobacter hormaechei]
MRFLPEVIENVLRYFLDTQGVQKCLLVFSRAEFFLVCFRFKRLKLWADIVIVHLKLQHFFITNRISNYVRM